MIEERQFWAIIKELRDDIKMRKEKQVKSTPKGIPWVSESSLVKAGDILVVDKKWRVCTEPLERNMKALFLVNLYDGQISQTKNVTYSELTWSHEEIAELFGLKSFTVKEA